MKKILLAFLLSLKLWAQYEILPVTEYGAGSFLSIVVDLSEQALYYAPSRGATYITDEEIPREKTVRRGGGHAQVTRFFNLQENGRGFIHNNLAAGGIKIFAPGEYEIVYFSRSVNGTVFSGVGTYAEVPEYMRQEFATIIASSINSPVYIDGRKVNPVKNIGHKNPRRWCSYLLQVKNH